MRQGTRYHCDRCGQTADAPEGSDWHGYPHEITTSGKANTTCGRWVAEGEKDMRVEKATTADLVARLEAIAAKFQNAGLRTSDPRVTDMEAAEILAELKSRGTSTALEAIADWNGD